jgi:hypothetical protein
MRLALAAAMLASVLLPAAADGQSGSRQSASLEFGEREPATATGFTLRIDYVNPNDPNAKPPAVRRVVEELARGSRIDTSVPALCRASDIELILRGASACPADSRVGAGTIVVDTGLPLGPARFLATDVVFLNNSNQLIFLVTERISGLRLVFRAAVSGARIVNTSPFLPGMLPDGSAIDVVDVRIDRVVRESDGVRRGYVTTPAACPESGAWTNRVSFTYADGVTQIVDSRSECVKEGAGAGRCATRLTGGPKPDRLRGTVAGERILGLGGADRLAGRGGDDCLRGHRGDDRLRGGAGADALRGGGGFDVCLGGKGRDRVRGCERVR